MYAGSLIFEAIVIFFLILINGFFSSAEIAIVSAKRSVIDNLAKDGVSGAATVAGMKENPEKFLATVQVGVTVVSTLASVIGGIAAATHLRPVFESIPFSPLSNSAELLSVGAVVIIISYTSLVIGELVPKSLALRYSEKIACFSARPLRFISKFSYIFIKILTTSNKWVLALIGIKGPEKRIFVSEEEIKFFIKEGRETGLFEETEAALLHGIFEFADTTVKEVMVPKHQFSAIELNTPHEKVLKFISDTGFSRYPVYKQHMEKVVGVLFNKDVFRSLEQNKPVVVSELLRTPYFVPKSIMISKLLREMQRRKIHIAIVVDEHGDVDGLVTIEDILEEIVGEIEDEYDVGKGIIERLTDGTMVVDASASLRDLEDITGLSFDTESEEYHTLAGFMLAKLQRIPRGGEFVIHKDHRFTVVDVELNRIIKVKVEALEAQKKNGV